MPASLTLIAAPVASFAVAVGTLSWLLRGRMRELAMDRPNERSLHARPIPRTGGLAIMAGVVAGCVLVPSLPWAALLLALTLGLLSFADDLRSLPISVRFAAQLAAAGVFTLLHLAPLPHVLWAVPVVLGIVWVSNLFNFMDGSDGLAGGMALIGFGAYAAAALLAGDSGFALLNLCVAAAALAFLLFNFPPARIFMGDAGSIPLGFLAAALGAQGWSRGLWPAWFPMLVFSPFIADATVTLLRRLARRERVWRAHREHYYQRLVQMGWGHRGTALAEYGVMLAAAASALWGARQAPGLQLALGAAWLLAYVVMAAWVDRGWKRYAAQGGGSR